MSSPGERGDTRAFSTLYKKLVGAANVGDVHTYVSCYTEDGVMMPPHAQPIVGQAALEAYMTEWRKAEPYEVAGDQQEVAAAEAARIDAEYDAEKIKALIANDGWA